jgi:CHAT domain-containing protein/tetratricopeptide (TPR) repeat protein
MLHRLLSFGVVAMLGLACIAAAAQNANEKWAALDARVNELYARGDLREAIDVAQAALRAAASPRETGRSLDRLGFLYYTSGDLANGEKYLRQSLLTRESAFGPDSLDAAETANDLAMLLRDLRRMDEARALAERAVAVRERLLGAHAPLFAESLDTLGTVYGLAGAYDQAVTRFEQALAIHEERPPHERASEEYGTLCVNLAGTYQRLGKYAAAESAFRKGLDALRVKPGVDHPAFAASELAYAALEVDLGRYVEAERLYDDGGRLVLAELGDQHPVYATLLNNRGFFYQSIGNLAAAQADYQRSLELKEKLYGRGSLLTVSTLRNLAHLTYALDPQKGERLLARTVEAYAGLPNAPAFDYASVLIGLARAQRDRGALADARATAARALDVSRRGLGDHHPLFAAATRELGLTAAASGEPAEAERLMRDALAIAERAHGQSHPDVAGFLEALGDFYVAQRDFPAALSMYARSAAILDRFRSDVLEIGSESFKAATLTPATDPVPRLLALQAQAPQLSEARVLAFEAVTRSKGRITEQVRDWHRRLDENASSSVREHAREWQAFLGCRTSLTVALGYHDLKPAVAGSCTLEGTDLEGRYERLLSDLRSRWTPDVGARAVAAITELQQRANAVETVLNREAGPSIGNTSRVTAADLRTRLGAHEALIEVVSYTTAAEMQQSKGIRRYGAFVLTGNGHLGWTDLGPSPPIDRSIGDLLMAAKDWSISTANRETASARASMQTADDAIGDLSTRVWRPLRPLVEEERITALRIAPDALLNLLPFEALAEGRRALIDRFAITYVPAGRDLMATTRVPSAAPVLVVSPGASAPRAAAQPARHAPAQSETSFRANQLSRLDAALGEAADIRRLVPGIRVYTGPAATERRVKDVHGPALLHIVGHGVVRSSEDCGAGRCASMPLSASMQAMSLAALVLEEAYGRGGASPEDGLLTALELQNMDLRGTEMLVLSQCQMASGLASVGEGVYGMRRAAAMAGASTFVAPLWNVEDAVQRRLMKRFYEGLAAGHTRADALRTAKLSIRQSAGTRSFLYWAPVIMSGAAGPVSPSLFGR